MSTSSTPSRRPETITSNSLPLALVDDMVEEERRWAVYDAMAEAYNEHAVRPPAAEGSIDPIFVSVKQAARALNISPWACYQLLDAGKIKSQYAGRRRLVRVDSLRAYADALPATPGAGLRA
jgi:excisionase family DNA binding protein